MAKAERQSNIEILKIIAMFFICISHVVNPIIYNASFPDWSLGGDLIYTLIKNLGWMGDYIFIAASAFFLVGSKKWQFRKIILYYVEVLLVFFIYLGVFKLFKIPVSSEGDYVQAVQITLNTTIIFKYWFIVAYILYLLLLPLVNLLIDKLPQKAHLIICWCTIPVSLGILVLHNLVFTAWWLNVTIFLFMSIIMAYGRKYGWYLCFREDNKKGLIIGLCLAIATWIGKNIIFSVLGKYGYAYQDYSLDVCGLNDPIYFFIGIPLLLLFKNLKVKNSKVINFISSCSLIFYVSHHNKYTELVFHEPFIEMITANPKYRLLILLAAAVFRFIFGLVVSAVYCLSVHKLLSLLVNIKFKKKEKAVE